MHFTDIKSISIPGTITNQASSIKDDKTKFHLSVADTDIKPICHIFGDADLSTWPFYTCFETKGTLWMSINTNCFRRCWNKIYQIHIVILLMILYFTWFFVNFKWGLASCFPITWDETNNLTNNTDAKTAPVSHCSVGKSVLLFCLIIWDTEIMVSLPRSRWILMLRNKNTTDSLLCARKGDPIMLKRMPDIKRYHALGLWKILATCRNEVYHHASKYYKDALGVCYEKG